MSIQNTTDDEDSDGRPVIDGKRFCQTVFEDEKFNCFDFLNTSFEDAVFIRCDLRGSDFSSSSFSHVIIYQCWIYGATFCSESMPTFIECENSLSCPPKSAPVVSFS